MNNNYKQFVFVEESERKKWESGRSKLIIRGEAQNIGQGTRKQGTLCIFCTGKSCSLGAQNVGFCCTAKGQIVYIFCF